MAVAQHADADRKSDDRGIQSSHVRAGRGAIRALIVVGHERPTGQDQSKMDGRWVGGRAANSIYVRSL